MKRALTALALAVVLMAANQAQAQLGRPPASSRSPVSPYLGIFSGGNPAIGYFNITQPLENMNTFQQQQIGINSDLARAQQQNLNDARNIPATGSGARFMSYSQYFMNVGGQRVGAPANANNYAAPNAPIGTIGLQVGQQRR